jgi:hypothetical protein
MAFNSFVVMLGLEDLDFSSMDLIFHPNSTPRVCENLETMDSTAHAIHIQVGVLISYGKIQTFHEYRFLRVCENVFGKSENKLLEADTGVGLFC